NPARRGGRSVSWAAVAAPFRLDSTRWRLLANDVHELAVNRASYGYGQDVEVCATPHNGEQI
ncbi:MAG TPA: hypothetical protein VIJ03_10250, partial [Candidatus Dormibacteraeota bacterium]